MFLWKAIFTVCCFQNILQHLTEALTRRFHQLTSGSLRALHKGHSEILVIYKIYSTRFMSESTSIIYYHPLLRYQYLAVCSPIFRAF